MSGQRPKREGGREGGRDRQREREKERLFIHGLFAKKLLNMYSYMVEPCVLEKSTATFCYDRAAKLTVNYIWH